MSLTNAFQNLSLTRFLEEIDEKKLFWVIKRLSGNDVGLTKSHQAGVYFPKEYGRVFFPEVLRTDVKNPDNYIDEIYFPNAQLSSQKVRAIYYNNKFHDEKGKRNEFRLTGWGGKSSPAQNPENAGAIFILAMERDLTSINGVAWVAENEAEENEIEEWAETEIAPDLFYMRNVGGFKEAKRTKKQYSSLHIPSKWFEEFPSCSEIFDHVVTLAPYSKWKKSIDQLLLHRRNVEFEIFKSVEEKYVWPTIESGFTTVEDFIKFANSVSNRRKSRTGTSLELNLESIFKDKQIAFETQVITEIKKKPDFLFPSGKAYHNSLFPSIKLNMLAAKTCCKDRWRQVCTEANRIETKHLFTLQKGVSTNQLHEMASHNVELVVPEPHLKAFPEDWRESLLTLESFVGFIKEKQTVSNMSDNFIELLRNENGTGN